MEEKYLQEEEPEAERNLPFLTKNDLSKKSVVRSFAAFDVDRLKGKSTLSKEERLKSKKIIEQLFKQGKSVSSNGFTLVYLPTVLSSYYPAQAGFSVPKKFFNRAVDRNSIKRLMREVYRTHKHLFYQKLVTNKIQMAVMFVYTGKKMLTIADVEKGVIVCMDKVLKS